MFQQLRNGFEDKNESYVASSYNESTYCWSIGEDTDYSYICMSIDANNRMFLFWYKDYNDEENKLADSSDDTGSESSNFQATDYIVGSTSTGENWINALEILLDAVDYDTVLEASDMLSNTDCESLEEFMYSTDDRTRYLDGAGSIKVIYLQYGWVGSQCYQVPTFYFDNGICNKMSFNVHVSKGDSMETLLKDLKEKFPNSGEAEKIDEYNLEIDLGDGYCLTMGSLEEFGGDKGSWSVAIKKE